jgi:hypothetical protein
LYFGFGTLGGGPLGSVLPELIRLAAGVKEGVA